ncbi:MAG: hypothetical protein AAF488_02725 [Planctomycetota bacterium]
MSSPEPVIVYQGNLEMVKEVHGAFTVAGLNAQVLQPKEGGG